MRTIGDVNLNAITAFLQVAEVQSFRGAAKALGVPKSTMSQRIADLEHQLGVQLFWRSTRTVRLTDIGENYYRAVKPALSTILDAERQLSGIQDQPRGRLRMSAPVELGQCFLGTVLMRYADLYPDVEVIVDLSDRKVNLIEEGFDLAIRIGPLDDSSLICRKLSVLGSKRLYASPNYLDRNGTPRSPQDLADHTCLVMSGDQDAVTWRFNGPDGSVSYPIRPRISVASWTILRELTLAGVGICQLPEMNGLHDAAEGRLVELLPDWALPGDASYAVYPSSRNPSAALRSMVDLLRTHLSDTLTGCGASGLDGHRQAVDRSGRKCAHKPVESGSELPGERP